MAETWSAILARCLRIFYPDGRFPKNLYLHAEGRIPVVWSEADDVGKCFAYIPCQIFATAEVVG